MAQIHFVLPTDGNLEPHLDIICVWMKTNPSKKIVLWYDTLADVADFVFDAHGLQDTSTEAIIGRKQGYNYKYFKQLNGYMLLKPYVVEYFTKFKNELDNRKMSNKAALLEILNQIENEMMTNVREKDPKKKLIESVTIAPDILEKLTKKEKYIRDYFFKKNIDQKIDIIDLYTFNQAKLFNENLYNLYSFEICNNRDQALAHNFFMYLISEKFRNELVLTSNLCPTLNGAIFEKEDSHDIFIAALMKIQDKEINSLDLSDDIKIKINSTPKEQLFTPLDTINNTQIYASITEAEAKMNYLLFPRESNKPISEYVNAIYKKRFDQIQFLALDTIEGAVRIVANDRFKDLKYLKEFFKTVDSLRNTALDHFESFNTEFMKQTASKFSHYKEYISDSTGSKYWSIAGERLHEFNCIDMNLIRPEMIRNPLRANMNSDFDLEIGVNFEHGFFGGFEHPIYNKNNILFIYEPDQNIIKFKESNILIPTGKTTLQEKNVRSYIRNLFQQNKKIRIQVFEDSTSKYVSQSIYRGEQTIAGLNVDQFSSLFVNWFKKYLNGIDVNRLAFVSCNIVNSKDFHSKSTQHLPTETFLGKFISHFKQSMIKIKEIVASDEIVGDSHISGQTEKLQTHTESNFMKKLQHEIKKILINCEQPSSSGKYTYKSVDYKTNLTDNQIPMDNLCLSETIFDNSNIIQRREVLNVPLNVENLLNEIVKVNVTQAHGHFIAKADTLALVACTQERFGKILIIDTVPEKIEAVRLALRMAVVLQDYVAWKMFLNSYFPNAYKFLEPFVNSNIFHALLENISSARITFIKYNLSEINAHVNINNYLNVESGNSFISLIYAPNQESDIIRTIDINQFGSIHAENFTFDREIFLERRQLALEHMQTHMRENIRALMQGETRLIYPNNNGQIQWLDELQIESQWHIEANTPLELVSREAFFAATFCDTYYMARDLYIAFQEMITLYPNEITPNHVPLFDTLELDQSGSWNLSFIDVTDLHGPSITKKTKKPIFQKVKNVVQKISVNHITMVGSTSLNFVFGIQSLCHWIEYGFKANTKDISSQVLATAIEVHFYVNAIGVIQSVAETGISISAVALSYGIESAKLIPRIKPYIEMSMKLFQMSSGGRVLLSLGRYTLKALPAIGMIINGLDLAFNIFDLINNEDPAQRPMLITNTVFSAVGLTISGASIVAALVGATSLLGPLALVGLSVALITLPVTYIVGTITSGVQSAKNIGLYIKKIVEEIKHGAYTKNNDLLMAPSFIPVQSLKLLSNDLVITLGDFGYFPTADTNHNDFIEWFHIEDKYASKSGKNMANIQIDDKIRTLMLPHVPDYRFVIRNEYVPFTASRDDAEFKEAKELQRHDKGFTFQQQNALGFADLIANHFYLSYIQTEIDINIKESNWKLIFPWASLSDAKNNKEKKQFADFNKNIKENLSKIVYNLKADSVGKQMIQLPELECPVNLNLISSNNEIFWFIEFFEKSISNKDFVLSNTNDNIKVGKNINIKFSGKKAKVFIVVPNFQDLANNYNGIAYFDVAANTYIYVKNLTKDKQKNVFLLFTTKSFAYFYKPHNESTAKNSKVDGSIWGINIETKEIDFENHDVKLCDKSGEGLVITTNSGIMCYINEDYLTRKLVSQIYGFGDGFFNKHENPMDALKAINSKLENDPHFPNVHFYLPYGTNEFNASISDIVFYAEKQKYFLIGAKYANYSIHPTFLMYDEVSGNAYFYAKNQGDLIIAMGLNIDEISKKMQFGGGKVQIDANGVYKRFLKGVLDASMVQEGIKIRLSCGLELLLKTSQTKKSDILLNVQKLILNEERLNESDERTSIALQKSVSIFKNEHIEYSGKCEIFFPELIAIENNGKNIGFYEKAQERTMCTTDISNAYKIIPLGTDDHYAYYILDVKTIQKSKYVTHLSEIKNALNSKIRKDQLNLVFEADAITLINGTIYLKKDALENEFSHILKTISKLSGINFIWIESKKYTLNMKDFNGISIACTKLSQVDISTDIRLEFDKFEDYKLITLGSDLLLYNSDRKFTFIFYQVFEHDVIASDLAAVTLLLTKGHNITFTNTFKLSSLVNIFNYNPSLGTIEINLLDILKMIRKSYEEVYRMFDTTFWPNEDKKQKVYDMLQWIDANANEEKSKYLSEYLKTNAPTLQILMKRKNRLNNLLHLAIKDAKSSVILTFFKSIGTQEPDILKEFILKENADGKTALHLACENYDIQSLNTLIEEVKNYVGVNALKELILKTNEDGCNAMHYAIRNNNTQAIMILFETVNRHFGNTVLEELIQKCENLGNTSLNYAIIYGNTETIKIFLDAMKKYIKKETRKELVLKTNNANQTALQILLSNEPSNDESIAILLSDINELFERITSVIKSPDDGVKQNILHSIASIGKPVILKQFFAEKKKYLEGKESFRELIFDTNSENQIALHILILKDKSECIQIFLEEVHEMFGKQTLKKMLLISETDTENALQFAICQNKLNATTALFNGIEIYLGDEMLKEMISFKEAPFFYYAISYGDLELFVTCLHKLKTKFDQKSLREMVSKTDTYGHTILHALINIITTEEENKDDIWAVQREMNLFFGNDFFNELLLKTTNANQTVLDYIVQYGKSEKIKKFWFELKNNVERETIKKLIMMKFYGKNFLHILISRDKYDIVQLFMNEIDELFGYETLTELILPTYLFHEIVTHGSLNTIRIFLQQMKFFLKKEHLKELIFQSNDIGEMALHILISNSKLDIIKILIDDVNELFGEETLNELMLKKNANGENVLHYIAANGSIDTLKVLWMKIKHYLKIDKLKNLVMTSDNSGQTILHILISKSRAESIQILLDEINIMGKNVLNDIILKTDIYKITVLDLAVSHGGKDIYKIFWQAMKKHLTKETLTNLISKSNYDGYNMLHTLILNSQFECISILLDGVNEQLGKKTLENLMLKNESGKNALQIALSKGNIETVTKLLTVAKIQLGKPILREMIMKPNANDQNAFQYAKSSCPDIYQKFLELVSNENLLGNDEVSKLWLKGLA